jgi:hypothetical protein
VAASRVLTATHHVEQAQNLLLTLFTAPDTPLMRLLERVALLQVGLSPEKALETDLRGGSVCSEQSG